MRMLYKYALLWSQYDNSWHTSVLYQKMHGEWINVLGTTTPHLNCTIFEGKARLFSLKDWCSNFIFLQYYVGAPIAKPSVTMCSCLTNILAQNTILQAFPRVILSTTPLVIVNSKP